MLYGEHLHADERPAQCKICPARAVVEVLDGAGRSHGCFCLRCGRAAFERLEKLEQILRGRSS